MVGTAKAQHITVDGSLSPAQTLIGPNYTIGANLGKQVGGNLFQSFGIFGLSSGETANFTGPANVSNIVGRVTGGNQSSINGRVESSIAGANLYLINPSGIVLGPNATINVSGSFHAATADYLKMTDGAKFQATNPSGSTFSAAPPAAFGFLNAAPPSITVNGSQLSGPAGTTLGLVGGPVTITGGASVAVPSGTVHVTGVAGTGEVPVDPTNTAGYTVASYAPVVINGGSLIDVSNPANAAAPGGSIFIHSNMLTIDGSVLDADNFGPGAGGTVQLSGTGQITLSNGSDVQSFSYGAGTGAAITLTTGPTGNISIDNSTVQAGAVGSGGGGNIALNAGSLTVSDSGLIESFTQGTGNAGSLSFSVSGAFLLTGSTTQATQILSEVDGPGSGGAIDLTAGSLTVTGASINSNTNGAGTAGPMNLNVAGSLVIDGAGIPTAGIISNVEGASGGTGAITVNAQTLSLTNLGSLDTTTSGSGNAGNVAITVAGLLSVDGASGNNASGIGSQALHGTGNAGDLAINAGTLSLTNGGLLSTTSFDRGNSGAIAVSVDGPLTIDGGSAKLNTGIFSNSQGVGAAGSLNVGAQTLAMSNGAGISTETQGPQPGGNIVVSVDGQLSLTNQSIISSTADPGSSGDGGSVAVNAGSLSLTDIGQIASTTYGSGNGGAISVSVADGVSISGGSSGTPSGIFSVAEPRSTGNGGTVAVNAGSLTIGSGGSVDTATAGFGTGGEVTIAVAGNVQLSGPGPQISAGSTGSGDAGSIQVAAANLRLSGGASISTQSATANGGDITLSISDLMLLTNSSITTSVHGSIGNGGNILVDPDFLVLDASQIIAQAFAGNGGNITLVAGNILETPDSLISASSQLGISGTVDIEGPQVDLNGSLVVLSDSLRASDVILNDACATRGSGLRSSLVNEGRGGTTPDPGAALPALYFVGHDIAGVRPGTAGADAVSALPVAFDTGAQCQ